MRVVFQQDIIKINDLLRKGSHEQTVDGDRRRIIPRMVMGTYHKGLFRVRPSRSEEFFVDLTNGVISQSMRDACDTRFGNKPKEPVTRKEERSQKDAIIKVLEHSAKEVCKLVNNSDFDVATLEKLLELEKNTKDRKTVVAEIEQQIEQISE